MYFQETFLEEIDEEMAREHPDTHGHLIADKNKDKWNVQIIFFYYIIIFLRSSLD